MTNSNTYLEIEEKNYSQIEEDYLREIKEGKVEIPTEYKFNWVSNYLEDRE